MKHKYTIKLILLHTYKKNLIMHVPVLVVDFWVLMVLNAAGENHIKTHVKPALVAMPSYQRSNH